jgi:hypothetical protein
LTLILLNHQWKAFWRSRSAGINVVMQIFMGFIVLYFLGIAVFAGFAINHLITEVFPGQDVVTVFSGFILYFFLSDIIMRFLIQNLPTLAVQPYLVHNITRKQLVKFLNLRSLFSFFNVLPILLFVPFSVSQIGSKYGGYVAASFIISIISLTVFNHFLVLFIKRKTNLSNLWLMGFFVVLLIIIAADYLNVFSIRTLSASVFTGLLKLPVLSVITIALAIASVYNNSRFLNNNLYFENETTSTANRHSSEFAWLQRFGNIGDLIANDVKLIIRNKRPRSLLMFSVFFLFYGFLFYKPTFFERDRMGFLLFGATFITGMFTANYGQFLFAWQSDHFDGVMSRNVTIRSYLKSKFILLTAFSTATLILTMFYGLMSWKLIPIHIAAYLFNIGIHTLVAAYIATHNYKGIDLSKGSAFNYQGMGAAQWLYALVIMLIGVVFYLPFALIFNSWIGVAAVAILGLISWLLQDWWIEKLVVQFEKRKYKILEGFRER